MTDETDVKNVEPVPVLTPILELEDTDLMMMADSDWDQVVRIAKERGRAFMWVSRPPKR